jgi:aminoglycoside 2''-phosphotransferase
MENKKLYISEIQNKYPNVLRPGAKISMDGGQYNDILIIDQAFVFRFPKQIEGIKTMVKEIKILNNIRGRLPLLIPDPIYSSDPTQAVGEVFMGYPMILGEPLRREVFNSIDDEAILERFASQLAGFLKVLHNIPYRELGLDIEISDSLDEWIGLFSKIQLHLYEFMHSDACNRVTQHFESFFDTKEFHSFTPVLRHGDFGSSNILFDPKSFKIIGILDFGFAGIGDRAIDLAAVSTFGDHFFQKILKHYPVSEMMCKRADFYRGTFALQEALYGWENKDQEAINAGIEMYLK